MSTIRTWDTEQKWWFSGSAVLQPEEPRQTAPERPSTRPMLRPLPAPRRREKTPWGLVLFIMVAGTLLMASGIVLITQWANIRLASQENLRLRAEIQRLQNENEMLEHQLAQHQSLARLEEQAQQLGMTRPLYFPVVEPDEGLIGLPPAAAMPSEPSWQERVLNAMRIILPEELLP